MILNPQINVEVNMAIYLRRVIYLENTVRNVKELEISLRLKLHIYLVITVRD